MLIKRGFLCLPAKILIFFKTQIVREANGKERSEETEKQQK